jgi:hypothetical protein
MEKAGFVMRKLYGVLLMLGLSGAVFASTITVSIVQNEAAPGEALELSRIVEDELFTDCFDGGHIVSNTDIRLDGSRFAEKSFSLKEAALGYSDYLIALLLEYGPNVIKNEELKTSWAELLGITWRVVDTKNGNVLGEAKVSLSDRGAYYLDPSGQSRLLAEKVGKDALSLVNKTVEGEKK